MGDINSLKDIYNKVCRAKSPLDVFQSLKDESSEEKLNVEYRSYMAKCHPDMFVCSGKLAQHMSNETCMMLNIIYGEIKKHMVNGHYKPYEEKIEEKTEIFEIKTKNNIYSIYEHTIEGEYANIYKGRCGSDDVCVKIVHDPSDNKLLMNEIKVMKLLIHKSLPIFIDVFKTTDKTMGLVMREIDGFDLTQLREKFPNGLSERHACWVFERLLSVLGFMHISRVLHGNIEPSNIMVRPRDHNSFLIDFMFSLSNPSSDDRIKVYSEEYSHKDILNKKKPMPHHDLYSLGKCMIYLLGGDVINNKFPSKCSPSLKKFILEFVYNNVYDAWRKHAELHKLRTQVLGHKGFVTFKM